MKFLMRLWRDHGDGGGGDPPPDPPKVTPEIKGDPTTTESVLKAFAEVTEAIQNGLGEREKLTKSFKKVLDNQAKLQARTNAQVEFDVGATKDLHAQGGMKAVIASPSEDERVKRLQRMNDDALIVDALLRGDPENGAKYVAGGGIKSLNLWGDLSGAVSDFEKAMDTATAGEGAEWVPSMLSAELQKITDLELKVAALHPSFPMPAPTYKLPILKGHITPYKAAEQIAFAGAEAKITKSIPPTDDITFTAVKIGGRVIWTGELDEDSVIPMLPMLREDMGLALGRGIEQAWIDGQPGGTIDTGDAPGATDVRALWDGYRKYAETNSAVKVDLSAAFTFEGFVSVRKKLGKVGINPADLAWVMGPSVFYQLLSLKDANNNPIVVPLYAYGAQATALTGELGRLMGIPVIVSEFVREDLNATGIYDGVTETYTVVGIVHRPSWMTGTRREVTVRASDELYMEYDAMVIVATARMDVKPIFPFASQVAMALGYKITS